MVSSKKMTPMASQGVVLLGGVPLLEEVCHWGFKFEVSDAQARSNVAHCLFLLSADADIKLSATMSVYEPPFPATAIMN